MKERKTLSSQQASLLGIVDKFNQNGQEYKSALTEEENVILNMFLVGGTNASIGREIGISDKRVGQILVNRNNSIYSKLRRRFQLYSIENKRGAEAKLTKEEVLDKLESLDRELLNDALKSLNLAHLKKILREAERQDLQEPILNPNSEDILNDLKF